MNGTKHILSSDVSRRSALQSGAGVLAGALLPGGLILPARAADNAPLGSYPEGSSGPSVFVGIPSRARALTRRQART